MAGFILTIWLTSTGPELTMTVPDCDVGKIWYQQAVLWAARSGIPKDGPGWMCGEKDDETRVWMVTR